MISIAQMTNIAVLNTIGLSILCETLVTASKFLIYHSTSQRSEPYKCYMFVQGTGLDALIERYHLDYNPDYLRESFNYYVGKFKNGHSH